MRVQEKTVVVRLSWGETIEVCYAEQGRGKKTLIFLHGWLGSKREFVELLFPHMPKRGWRWIAIDLSGFGRSPRLEYHVNDVAAYVELVRAVMDALGIKRAYLYGMSMGGAISLSFGATYPARAIAIAAQGAPENGKEFSRALSWFAQKLQSWSKLGPITFGLFWMGFKELVAANPLALQELFRGFMNQREATMISPAVREIGMQDLFDSDVVAVVEAATSLTELDLRNALRRYTVPVLVLDGEQPASRALESAPRIMRLLPHGLGRVHLFPDVGHMATLLCPEDAVRATLTFFRSARNMRPR